MLFEHRTSLIQYLQFKEIDIVGEELNGSFEYPEYDIEERLVRYYEITEEDLFNVFYRFIHETIYGKRRHANEEYIEQAAKAYLDQIFYVPHPELVFYNIAKAKRESHFDMKASPSTSSAAGFGQVIYRWHGDKLQQSYDWRQDAPITRQMLATDFKASVDAQYIVFESYWRGNQYNYIRATDAYFGLNNSAAARQTYRMNLLNEYNLLTQRLFRMVLSKEPKYKLLKIHQEEVIDEKVLNSEEVAQLNNVEVVECVVSSDVVVSQDVTE